MKLFCFGLGYSAQRMHQLFKDRFETFSGCVRDQGKAASLCQQGMNAQIYSGGLPSSAMQDALLHSDVLLVSAAPGEDGDPMLKNLNGILHKMTRLRQVIYWSTVGVYGDHAGAWIDETAGLNAISQRGIRRIEAEQAWQEFTKTMGIPVQIHRLAGIYGPGRSAIDDVMAGTARRIIKEGQVFNRIHVDDIAGAAMAGIEHPEARGAFNICDDEPCPPQDVVEYAARLLGRPLAPAIPFASAKMSEMGRSFYSESKRCSNARLKNTVKYSLHFQTYREGLEDIAQRNSLNPELSA
jgi:nucleoside-diphosphate-sugar epimerase